MASNQFQHDHALPEDFEPPVARAPELSPVDDAAGQLLREQWIPGMNELTWAQLVQQVGHHPDFSDALSELAHGDCRPLRELTKATAVSMVRHHMRTQRGEA